MLKIEKRGKHLLDILPYTITDHKHLDIDSDLGIEVGEQWYKRPFRIHRNVGADNNTVVCPTTFGKKCPICDYKTQKKKEGADWDELKTYNPSSRNLYIVIPRGIKGHEEVPHIFDYSDFLFQEELNKELEENPDAGIFPDPDEGFSLLVRFDEETFGKNKFFKASRIDFEERETLGEDAEHSIDLDSVLTCFSYEKIEKMFFDLPVDDDGAEEDEDAPPPPRAGKSSPAKKKPVIDEDPDEDPDDDTPPPTRKGKTPAIPKGMKICVACEGTGKNSRGKECPICEGEGFVPDVKKGKGKDTTENECPHGFKFGKDCEKYDECDACDKWDECFDAKEELRKSK